MWLECSERESGEGEEREDRKGGRDYVWFGRLGGGIWI